MKRFMIALAGIAFASGVTLAAAGAGQDAKVAAGKKIYDTNQCKTCHLAEKAGNKQYPLDGISAKMSDADIRKWMTATAEMEAKLKEAPKVKMSAMWKKKLGDEDLEALVAYIKSLK
jgi:mono/diheme cytochrome c family protein